MKQIAIVKCHEAVPVNVTNTSLFLARCGIAVILDMVRVIACSEDGTGKDGCLIGKINGWWSELRRHMEEQAVS